MALGYTADIYQAWWTRGKHYGVPHRWFAVWFGLMVLQVLGAAVLCVPYWYLGAPLGFLVALGELGLLAALTRCDQEWDALNMARVRTAHYYEAD